MSVGLAYYAVMLILSVFLTCVFFGKWQKQYDVSFMLMFVLILFGEIGYFYLALSRTLPEAILANKVVYISGIFVMPAYFTIVSHLCQIRLSGWLRNLMFLLAGFCYFNVLTIGITDWYYRDTSIVFVGDVCVLHKTYGPLHIIYYIYLVAYAVLGLGCLIYCFVKKRAVSSKNLTILMIAQIIVMGSFFFGRTLRADIEITPLGYNVMMILTLAIIDRLCLYDVSAGALATVMDTDGASLISFDLKRNYLGSNEAAQHNFPELSELRVDRPLPEAPGQTSGDAAPGADPKLLELIPAWIDEYESRGRASTHLLWQGEWCYRCIIYDLRDHRKKRGYHITLADTTLEQKYIRRLEEEKENAEKASREKTAFLSNLSHEIRTPINSILGMDEVILRESQEPETLSRAEDIRGAGNALLGLINDVLDLSRIEAGKMEIQPVRYELKELIRSQVGLIKDRARSKNLDFLLEVDEQIPSVLYGDELRIRQIITNLLTNALKYTQQGGFSLKMTSKPYTRDQILLQVSVSDTGIGIREEELDRLFGAFERLDMSRNRTVEGTGLGMPIVKQLLDLMGSELHVESVYGEGSTFSFEIVQNVLSEEPVGDCRGLLEGEGTKKRESYHVSFRAPKARILAVDDTHTNLMVIQGLLRHTQIPIDLASCGTEALDAVRKQHYDLILLDHRMPGMDGIETLAAMRRMTDNLSAGVPIIALTANAVAGAREEYLKAGFTDYLSKPVDPMVLEETVARYLPKEKVEMQGSAAGGAGSEEAAGKKRPELTDSAWAESKARLREAAEHMDYLETERVLGKLREHALTPEQERWVSTLSGDLQRLDWDRITKVCTELS